MQRRAALLRGLDERAVELEAVLRAAATGGPQRPERAEVEAAGAELASIAAEKQALARQVRRQNAWVFGRVSAPPTGPASHRLPGCPLKPDCTSN